MTKKRWNMLKALEFTQQKRSQVRPNEGFVNQLGKYEQVALSA